MVITPTWEQQDATDAFQSGGNLILQAGTGTGKTSTLRLLTEADPDLRFLYLAYNRAIAADSKRCFGRNTDCMTAHGFAFRHLRRPEDPKITTLFDRLDASRITYTELARWLGIRDWFRVSEDVALQPRTLARLARETVTRWCYSEDVELTHRHVPDVPGVPADVHSELTRHVANMARVIWTDATNSSGRLRTEHDYYLKVFAMQPGSWGYDVILLDEAQDSNACVATMADQQTRLDTRLVVVGDSAQAIYGWRGAVDSMSRFPADHHARLTQSFRFGPEVAEEANKWLNALQSDLRLSGTRTINSRRVDHLDEPDAVLCRTNAEAMRHLMQAHAVDQNAAIVGGGQDARRMAEAAGELKAGGSTAHPELCAFTSWGAVQDFVDQDGGSDLKALVGLIDEFGADTVIDAVDRAVPEKDADVTVSTAHRAKGREWDRVRVGDDFPSPKVGTDPAPGELMLAYVTVTRAQRELDRGSLSWVDEYVETADTTTLDNSHRDHHADDEPDSDQPTLFSTEMTPPPATATTRGVSLTLTLEQWQYLDTWASTAGVALDDVLTMAVRHSIQAQSPGSTVQLAS